jgi:hypothetical protein
MKLLTAFSVFAFSLFAVNFSKAQETYPESVRASALAGSSASLDGSWALFGNQAGLATVEKSALGGSFQNRFLVKELSSGSGFFVFPVQSSVFAVSVYQFGKSIFRHEKIGLAYARKLNPRLRFGLQFNYHRLFIAEENKSADTYGLELGFQYRLSDRLVLGFHSRNPYKISLKTLSGEFSYPSVYTLGGYYRLSDSFGWTTELAKDLSHPLILKSGFEYSIREQLFLRTGISGKPYQLTAGLGFAANRLKIDMAVAYNQYLGNSPSVSFQYQF